MTLARSRVDTTTAAANPVWRRYLRATVNGITSAPLPVVVMLAASDRNLIGPHRPGTAVRALGWPAVAAMGTATTAVGLSGL